MDYGTPLWKFQEECVDKLRDQLSALIGDEMGTGKTREGMARDFVLRKDHGSKVKGTVQTLVVCPKSVIPVWSATYAELFPRAKVYDIVADNPASREAFTKAALKGSHHVYVTHWEALRFLVGNSAKPGIEKVKWFHVIADECHRQKNRKAQQSQAIKRIPTFAKTAMSGTAADDKPQDIWSVLNWLRPKEYSSYWRFFNRHIVQKEEYAANGRPFKKMIGVDNVDEFLADIEPFYVRRLKEEVLPDLPDKYYSKITVTLGSKQRKAYDEMRKNMLAWVGEQGDVPIAAPVVIAQLTRLQQFACAYAKIEERWVTERNKKFDPSLPEEEFVPSESIIEHVVENKKRNWKTRKFLKGFILLDEPSSKLDAMMDLLEDNPDEQFVVFSQSKQVINLLAKRLANASITHGILTGDTKQEDRGSLVAEFQAGNLKVFAGTISAGGVGITLTAASTVVFLDRAWSPSINKQAEDRLHRAGQKNAVQVIDIIAEHTIDLGRLQRIELKWTFLKRILGDKVSPEELAKIDWTSAA